MRLRLSVVTFLAPVVTARPATYVKVANFPGRYRHARSGRYYASKQLNGIRRERSLQTSDRKIAERKLKEWTGNLDKGVDHERGRRRVRGGVGSPRSSLTRHS